MKTKNLYEFITDKQNIQNCCKCPNKGQCDNRVCLVEAHNTINNKGFTPYNQATYEQRKLL